MRSRFVSFIDQFNFKNMSKWWIFYLSFGITITTQIRLCLVHLNSVFVLLVVGIPTPTSCVFVHL